MLTYVIQKQFKPNFLWLNLFYIIFFLFIYTLVDSFNMSYETMAIEFGVGLGLVGIFGLGLECVRVGLFRVGEGQLVPVLGVLRQLGQFLVDEALDRHDVGLGGVLFPLARAG